MRATTKRKPTVPNMSRNKLIQLIHVAKKQLGLTDENYRAVVAHAKPKATSCTELNLFQLGVLYKALRAAGFEPTRKKMRKKAPQPVIGGVSPKSGWATEEQLSYIRGLWRLAARSKGAESLDKFCNRITGIATVRWLGKDDATKLILALRDITKKAGFHPDRGPA